MNTEKESATRMIGMKEYAERHGYNRNTVSYWCQKGMLKGVVKQPDNKSGFAKYIYLIPEDAQPKKQTAESIAAERGLLTVKECAARMGCGEKTVVKWCGMGKLPGAVKAEKGNGFYFWLIPEDAEPIKPYRPQEPRAKKEPPPKPKPKRQMTEREISQHLIRYCGMHSYERLSQDTGKNVQELRERYDRLHERLGI